MGIRDHLLEALSGVDKSISKINTCLNVVHMDLAAGLTSYEVVIASVDFIEVSRKNFVIVTRENVEVLDRGSQRGRCDSGEGEDSEGGGFVHSEFLCREARVLKRLWDRKEGTNVVRQA